MDITIVGVDPGSTTGIFVLHTRDGRADLSLSCSGQVKDYRSVLNTVSGIVVTDDRYLNCVLAVEKFVVGSRAGRSATPKGGENARVVVALLGTLPCFAYYRSASQVKPWATDKRLKAAGLLALTSSTHTRDAARHALFCAVHDGYLPDPLSDRWKLYEPETL